MKDPRVDYLIDEYKMLGYTARLVPETYGANSILEIDFKGGVYRKTLREIWSYGYTPVEIVKLLDNYKPNEPQKVHFNEVIDEIIEVFEARELINNKWKKDIKNELRATLEIFFAKNQGNYL